VRTEYELRVRSGSDDARDVGWFEEIVLGRSPDGDGLRRLSDVLNEAARSARDAFMAGPIGRTPKERYDAMKEHADVIERWFDLRTVKNLAGVTSFHVREVLEIPRIDLSRLDAEPEASS